MPRVVKHAWTHRPRSEGGTDPIEVAGIKWAHAAASAQAWADVFNIYLATFDVLYSNDATAFAAADVTAGRAEWIQINEPGFYVAKFSIVKTVGGAFTTNGGRIFPVVEIGGAAAELNTQVNALDFPGIQFNLASYIKAAQTDAPIGLYTEAEFHWNPDNQVFDLDFENPLKIGLGYTEAGAAATITFEAYISLVRMAGVGYTDLSP